MKQKLIILLKTVVLFTVNVLFLYGFSLLFKVNLAELIGAEALFVIIQHKLEE